MRFLQLRTFPPNLRFAFLLSLNFILSTKHQLSPSNSWRSWCDGPNREETSIPHGPSPKQIWDLGFCHKTGHRHNLFPPGRGSGPPASLETRFRSDFSAQRGKRERARNTTLENLLKPAQLSLDGTLLKGRLFRGDAGNLYSQCSSTLVAKQLNSLN